MSALRDRSAIIPSSIPALGRTGLPVHAVSEGALGPGRTRMHAQPNGQTVRSSLLTDSSSAVFQQPGSQRHVRDIVSRPERVGMGDNLQRAPRRARTAEKVFQRIIKSKVKDQFST
jgi:hypothetical protein